MEARQAKNATEERGKQKKHPNNKLPCRLAVCLGWHPLASNLLASRNADIDQVLFRSRLLFRSTVPPSREEREQEKRGKRSRDGHQSSDINSVLVRDRSCVS